MQLQSTQKKSSTNDQKLSTFPQKNQIKKVSKTLHS